MSRYDGIGFDLLTALLDTWTLWRRVAGDGELGMRWHAASQALLRGQRYRPFEEIVREAAREVGLKPDRADELLRRWGAFEPWPDVPAVLPELESYRRFIVTNCSRRLGTLAASRVGASFELVMTAEEAGAYKPDPVPYLAALQRLELAPSRVLFVAGSAHDVGGASRIGMDVYWANRGAVALPPGEPPIANEPGLDALPAILATARA
jgi:2-haloalkanoic acid dehalogenase type II